jgi:hypothetical protein
MGKLREQTFESRPDGEYAECRKCVQKGYGVDAWHPATAEFWPVSRGELIFKYCYACRVEYDAVRNGKPCQTLPEHINLPPRTIPYARNFGNAPVVHAVVNA